MVWSITLFLIRLPWLFTDRICSWRRYTPLIFCWVVNSNSCCYMALSSVRGRVRLIKILSICRLILNWLLFCSSWSLLSRGGFFNSSWFGLLLSSCFLFLTHHLQKFVFVLLSENSSTLFPFRNEVVRSC